MGEGREEKGGKGRTESERKEEFNSHILVSQPCYICEVLWAKIALILYVLVADTGSMHHFPRAHHCQYISQNTSLISQTGYFCQTAYNMNMSSVINCTLLFFLVLMIVW